MQEKIIKLTADDGFTFDAFRITPEKVKGNIIVLQEIFGVTEQLKSVARFFAGHGYDCIVPAMFDRVSPDTVVPFSDPATGRATMLQLDIAQTLLDVKACIAGFEADQQGESAGVTIIGYCWGGGIAVRAAGEFSLAGAVAYYGTSLQKHMGKGVSCPTLLHFGDSDSHSPPEVIESVKQALPTAEVHIYTAGHAFANEARETLVPEACEQANARTLAFLDGLYSE